MHAARDRPAGCVVERSPPPNPCRTFSRSRLHVPIAVSTHDSRGFCRLEDGEDSGLASGSGGTRAGVPEQGSGGDTSASNNANAGNSQGRSPGVVSVSKPSHASTVFEITSSIPEPHWFLRSGEPTNAKCTKSARALAAIASSITSGKIADPLFRLRHRGSRSRPSRSRPVGTGRTCRPPGGAAAGGECRCGKRRSCRTAGEHTDAPQSWRRESPDGRTPPHEETIKAGGPGAETQTSGVGSGRPRPTASPGSRLRASRPAGPLFHDPQPLKSSTQSRFG